MPLSAAEQEEFKQEYLKDPEFLPPEDLEDFRKTYPGILPDESAPSARGLQLQSPVSPTRQSPWYQRVGQYVGQYAKEQLYEPLVAPMRQIGERLETIDPQRTTDYGTKPFGEKLGKLAQDITPSREQLRTAMDILPLVWSVVRRDPTPLTPYALSKMTTGLRALNQYGPPILKALEVAGIDAVQTALANWMVDPEHPKDYIAKSISTGMGEYFGGVLGAAGGRAGTRLGESFRETPHGGTLRRTLEAEGGQLPFPGLTTGNPFLRSSSTFFEHMPGGKAMRTAREESQRLIDDALQNVQGFAAKPGRVSEEVARLNPSIPQKSTLDLERHLRPYFPMGDPADIRDVPKIVQTRLDDGLKDFKRQIRDTYQYLDTAIEQTPIPWHFGRKRLPVFKVEDILKMPELTQEGSYFHQTQNVIKALEALPDQITLNTAREAQGWLRSAIDEVQGHLAKVASGEIKPSTQSAALQKDLQYKVLPALGQSMQQLNEWINPLMVDLRPIQREAERVLGKYNIFPMSEAAALKGATGRIPAFAEDPHIQFAREILEKEPFVRFQDAQTIRSKAGEISRQPGVNVGNTLQETGKTYGDMLKIAMAKTADNLGPHHRGGLTTQWRAADDLYRQGAQVWNSDLLMELTGASLDDILTKIVRSERPNDLKTLRSVLGEDVFEDVGKMWLARKKLVATDDVTKVVNPQIVFDELKELTKVAEESLFPFGLAPLRKELSRSIGMQKLLTATDPLQARDAIRAIGPGTPEVAEAAAVRLSQLAEKHRGPTGQINTEAMLKELNSLGATEREIYGSSLAPLKKTLEQSGAMERAVKITDPFKLKAEMRLVDDPELWRAVQSEKLNPAFRIISDPMMPNGQMLDGKHLVDYLNTMRRRGELDAVFPDKTVVDHLYHLGQTAQALAQQGGRDVPYAGRHFPMLVRWTEAGAIIGLGFSAGHPLAAGTFLLGMQQLSKLMTDPAVAKWLTTGMRTPINARHVGEVAGALTGQLLSKGIAPSTGEPPVSATPPAP